MSDELETTSETEESVTNLTSDGELVVEEVKPKNDDYIDDEGDETEDEAEGVWNKIEPRGAFALVFIILAMYIVYWFLSYFEIFILRGA